MNEYFIIEASLNDLDEYLNPDNNEEIRDICYSCYTNEIQYVDRNPMIWKLKDFVKQPFKQDIIIYNQTTFFSNRLKELLIDECGVDYLFTKEITLKNSFIEEKYWICVPPRVKCLDMDNSEIDEDFGDLKKAVIIDRYVGRYDMFKFADVTNSEVVVTKILADLFKEIKPIGMHLLPLNTYTFNESINFKNLNFLKMINEIKY